MKTIKVIALTCFLLATMDAALADPPPGSPKPLPPDGVFCIQPTTVLDLAGGDTLIEFEVVNWTHDIADALGLSLGFGLNQSDPGITVVSAGFGPANDWNGAIVPNAFTADFTTAGGTPIPFIDLVSPFNNPFSPGPPDSGPNAKFGFEVVVNGWGPSERLVFDWGLNLPNLGPDPDSFDSGVWTMDRSSDPVTPGNLVRLTTWEQPNPSPTNGFDPIDFTNNPLDPGQTDQNATTFGIPEPSAILLSLMGTVGAMVWRRR